MGAEGLTQAATEGRAAQWPTVTIVLLSYNRRDELRVTLQKMLFEADYPASLIDVVVVDNASDDGSADMVAQDFPQVTLIRRDENCGVSGINDGFAVARGEWVLALDDDCYLPADGLRRAIEAARGHQADLVSFGVLNANQRDYRFDRRYRTGLLTYWGCSVLMRRGVVERLRGYDPEIFVWANELEFMLRFFDAGFRHLHLPEVVSEHIKETGEPDWTRYIGSRAYKFNTKHFAYVAGKLLRPRHAWGTFLALVVANLRDTWRVKPSALGAVPEAIKGFANGLRHRDPVRNAEISRVYRRNFHSFASPWWLSRPLSDLVRALPRELARGREGNRTRPVGRREQYYAEIARYYPDTAQTLKF